MRCRLASLVSLGALLLLTIAPSGASGAPSCAEGPQIVEETIVGTPCDDTIRAPRGITTVYGEGGNDTLYGQRGNDRLFGGEGNDRLYGGVGDDMLRGGPGDDRLSGGFGADSLDGEAGDDFARGDATVDKIGDSGGGTDTLSFATGVAPGFPNEGALVAYTGFPKSDGERGVYIELADNFANDGLAPDGGGVDKPLDAPNFENFEKVIGTPFSDIIVGGAQTEAIYGGGGADVILGEADHVFGGADGDYCNATGVTTSSCEFNGSDKRVGPRDASAIGVGLITPAGAGPAAFYLTGSNGGDEVIARYVPGAVTFELTAGSDGAFDPAQALDGECSSPSPGKATCPAPEPPDSIVLTGLDGSDTLNASELPETTSVVLLGGKDGDRLTGGPTEDALVDGPGDDSVSAAGGDDAVPNNQGEDRLAAGEGDDLFISDSICEGDVLDGGPGRDNANWANFDSAIAIDLGTRKAGLVGPQGQPGCPNEALQTNLEAIEDIEGTDGDDTLVGDSGENQLLGRPGHDSYFAAAGNDSILANSGDEDRTIDCGEGFDTAQVDHPEYGDPVPIDCEAIHERDPNSFRPPDTPTNPNPPAEKAPSPSTSAPIARPRPHLDRTPPRTRILRRPQKTVLTRSRLRNVVFVFSANEPGATFRCKLDRRRFMPCRSPRIYRLRLGAHTFRVFSIDGAGNRDRSPAVLRLRIRRR
ncbi:MAG TPA: calcium-binding protein [Solirubrobacterales bacterium]